MCSLVWIYSYYLHCVCMQTFGLDFCVCRLTGVEVPVDVGFTLALLTVWHGRHLLG